MNSGHSKALYSELKIDSKLTWCQRQLFRETKITCKTQNSFFVMVKHYPPKNGLGHHVVQLDL